MITDVPGYIKGILVALANTFLIALCIALRIDESNTIEAMFIICFMGFLPSLLVGGLLGHHGETMQHKNRRVVLIGMIAIACSTVALLGIMFDLSTLVFVSCIPTCAGCSILERWTRAPKDEIPFARVA